MKKQIGIIGVGTMGRIIMNAFHEAGFEVFATDNSPAVKKSIQNSGVTVCDAPVDVARQAELIIFSLPTPDVVLDVLSSEIGVIRGSDSRRIIVDTSTIDPKTGKIAQELCDTVGASYLDAPILGRPDSFGRWVLPVGGNEKSYQQVKENLSIFAKETYYVGSSGSGFTLKLLNQLMFSAINGVTAEMFAIAKSIGMDPGTVFDVISSSGAATVSGLFLECGRKIVQEDFKPVFPVRLLCKDAGLGVTMAKESESPPILSSTIQFYNDLARVQGYGDLDTSALYIMFLHMFEHRGGI